MFTHKNKVHPIEDRMVNNMIAKLRIGCCRKCGKTEKNKYCVQCGSCPLCETYINKFGKCGWCTIHDIRVGENIDTHYCKICELENNDFDYEKDCDYEKDRDYDTEQDQEQDEYEMKEFNTEQYHDF
jgi:hypothetical protein